MSLRDTEPRGVHGEKSKDLEEQRQLCLATKDNLRNGRVFLFLWVFAGVLLAFYLAKGSHPIVSLISWFPGAIVGFFIASMLTNDEKLGCHAFRGKTCPLDYPAWCPIHIDRRNRPYRYFLTEEGDSQESNTTDKSKSSTIKVAPLSTGEWGDVLTSFAEEKPVTNFNSPPELHRRQWYKVSYGLTHKLSGEHIDMHSLKETYSGFQIIESGRIIKEPDVDRIMFSKGRYYTTCPLCVGVCQIQTSDKSRRFPADLNLTCDKCGAVSQYKTGRYPT